MEYKHTAFDLKRMQGLSLPSKILITQTRIIEWYERHGGKCAVNFSGGIDSTVLLDLARRCYPDISAVFADTTLEYPEILEFVKSKSNVTVIKPQFCEVCVNCAEGCFPKIVRTHGWNFPGKNVAQVIKYARKGKKWALDRFSGLNANGSESKWKKDVFTRWAFLIDSPYLISDECCKILKEKPLNIWHKQTGNTPIIGTLASESRRRRNAWLVTGCNAFEAKKPVSKPLSFWTKNDILRYLCNFNVPYASIYGDIVKDKKGKLKTTGMTQTGCSLCPTGSHLDKISKFRRMKQTHPGLWDYGINTLGLGGLLSFAGVDYGLYDYISERKL